MAGPAVSSSSLRDTIGTIAVVPFGAQRLPELQTLYANCCGNTERDGAGSTGNLYSNATAARTTIRALQSGGRKLSHIRHLRRRATSYKRYKQSYYRSSNNNGSNDRTTSSHSPIIHNDPPQIHRQRRTVRRQNLKALCHLHEAWWWHPSNTTAGTSASQPIILPSTPQDKAEENIDNQNMTASINKSRTPAGTLWMTTHLFHRKRCHMALLWNWYLPLLHINRGCSAALRLVTTIPPTIAESVCPPSKQYSKCLIQDTTWSMQPIWFRIVTSSADDNPTSPGINILQQFQTMIQNMIPDFHFIESIANKIDTETNHMRSDDGGVMYEPFQFPRKAIGPVTWIYRKDYPILHCMNTNTNTSAKSNAYSNDYIYLFVHPSIRSVVFEHLEEMMVQQQSSLNDMIDSGCIHGPYTGNSNCSNDDPVAHQTIDDVGGGGGAMSCFQLRGSNESCYDCFLKCFTKVQQSPQHQQEQQAYIRMSETIMDASDDRSDEELLLPLYNFLRESQQQVGNHNDVAVFHLPLEFLNYPYPQPPHSEHHESDSETLPSVFPICLRRICPRDASMPCNWGVCGYDIYCPPHCSKVLFQNLILHGGACMIGIVEEAYIALECCPPHLIFPRDYPDTNEGQKYWNNSSVEWKLLRHYWESGGGRISKLKMEVSDHDTTSLVEAPKFGNVNNSCKSIIWKEVLGGNDDTVSNQKDVVVVRSKDFIRPFQIVLSGCTTFTNETRGPNVDAPSASGAKGTAKKRKRRSTNNSPCVEAARISFTQRRNHHLVCQSLIDNLSLPAVLMCSVQLIGKGTLHPGAGVFSAVLQRCDGSNDVTSNSELLGWVTAGSFSMARGCYYGICMIGAKAFITSIIACIAVTDTDSENVVDVRPSPLLLVPPPRQHQQYPQQQIVIHSCSLSKAKSVQLKALVENPNCPSIRYDGILSLL